ncbi:hypothetical protein BS78_05G193000 [Paspalum vaginatum]|nr:hypothetical protein BS78_05G193000 [Paspalum vaginatum]KAJ1276162.1 hypothetical protein BS78_05G193000 [Paspalum vaginatum]KAJ1276163.1 hypothetical protein BS78_05G193000 [Paspalum vaginatum]KAJ1276164.1 hypothetical protein BS78_05G193000 [Paspalum vaginatum]
MDMVTGVIGKLPSKLLDLLKSQYKLQTGVKDKVRFLSQELECMHAVLCKVAQVPSDQLNEMVRLWARDVREAAYDIEDILDTFLVRVDGGSHPDNGNRSKYLIKKTGKLLRLLSKVKARQDIASEIEDIKKQLQELTDRRYRYRVDDLVAQPSAAKSIDPRLSALYTKASQLIGMDEPMDRLMKLLSLDDSDMSNKEMKIVSVVGTGGLGKTTLAKAMYEKLTEDFYFKAFVPVGLNPDLKKVLMDILIGLDKQRYTVTFNLATLDERQLIDELREFLHDKRYLIVIDDIWDVPSWKIIRYALDDNSFGSKILITTRSYDVANTVSCSYKMEPLPYESSSILFYGRLFGSESLCPSSFLEVSKRILKKCGGVPLAIISISSLLASKSSNLKEWYKVCDSIGSGLGSNHDMDNMRKILSLSYYDLPSHLKMCLLYLSIFPEDYNIGRHRLIWRWIAEGFVYGEEGQSLFDLAESYFIELLNRSLIQPAYIDGEGTIWSCRVHDIVLDLICSLSREENFVTIALDDIKPNRHFWGCEVRRLSMQNTAWPTVNMSKLRSIAVFSPAITNSMPNLSCYRFMRVLDLHGCNLKSHLSLRIEFGNLFLLRYIGLSNTGYAGELPTDIGRVRFLQTLNLRGTAIKELPSSIEGLRQLMFLNVNEYTRLPNGLRNLVSLELLWELSMDSAYMARELGHLIQLRILGVHLKRGKDGRWAESVCKAFVQSLGNLHEIQYLSIQPDVAADLEGPVESIQNLRHLWMKQTSSLPSWINPSSLLLLSRLDMTVNQVRWEDIQALGMLQALCYLMLNVVHGIEVQERMTFSSDSFQSVTHCRFFGFVTVPSMFSQGCMPRLEQFKFCIRLEDFCCGEYVVDDLSIDHLPSIQSMHVYHNGRGKVSDEMVIKVEKRLKDEAHIHPNHPSITVIA